MEFTLQYSWWWWLLGICFAWLVSTLLYQKTNFDAPLGLKRFLFGTRFILICILTFLLLEPLLKSWKNITEKPILLLAHDNSQSINIAGDTNYFKNSYLPEWENLSNALSDKYAIETVTFGEKVNYNTKLSFTEKQSDLAKVFEEAANNYLNRNIAGIVWATDGIYNLGQNPEFLNYDIPVFAVALGDTTIRRDLILARVNNNPLTYKGNTFPVEVLVHALKFEGQKAKVGIYDGSTLLAEQEVLFDGNNEVKTLSFLVNATKSGLLKLSAKISVVEGELTKANNQLDFYVEVIEAREKILILANAPHPDVNAIKQALEENQNLSVEVALLSGFTKNIKDYNLLILHQVPSINQTNQALINQIKNGDNPVLYICGTQTNYNALSEFSGFSFTGVKPTPNDAIPLIDESFGLFNFDEVFINLLPKLPPLAAVYGNYKSKQESNVFLRQQIGTVKTNLPLVAFTTYNNRKEGFIFGEGLWRWRLSEYLLNENQTVFNGLMNKIVQFLSVKIDRSRFKVRSPRSIFENEELILNADYYNEAFELNNSPEVSLKLKSKSGKEFSYVFLKNGDSYQINLGQLPPDDYKYTATAKIGNKEFKDEGSLTIKTLQIERQDLTANHALLKLVAQKSGGMFFNYSQLNELKKQLLNLDTAKPIIYAQRNYSDLINLPVLFFVLLIFVAVEWFFRKFFGGY